MTRWSRAAQRAFGDAHHSARLAGSSFLGVVPIVTITAVVVARRWFGEFADAFTESRRRAPMAARWGVAELAKHRTVNPTIGGSSPPAPVVFDSAPCMAFRRAGRCAFGYDLCFTDVREAVVHMVRGCPQLDAAQALRGLPL